MQVEIGIDIIVTHMDEVVLVKWGFSPIYLGFWYHMPKDLYGRSGVLHEYVCDEVCLVVISSGDSGNWLRYCHRHLNQ